MALYLAYIAGNLKKSSLVEEVYFIHSSGNFLKPLLEIKPAGKLGKCILVVLHLEPAVIFKPSRFRPETNNARPNWFFKESVAEGTIFKNGLVSVLKLGVTIFSY